MTTDDWISAVIYGTVSLMLLYAAVTNYQDRRKNNL